MVNEKRNCSIDHRKIAFDSAHRQFGRMRENSVGGLKLAMYLYLL